jgi:hypothetical protein
MGMGMGTVEYMSLVTNTCSHPTEILADSFIHMHELAHGLGFLRAMGDQLDRLVRAPDIVPPGRRGAGF